jgi:6-phosphogluconate dehydrogenase
MIGAGSMGGMMSLLFAENGIEVQFYDPSEENVHSLLEHAKEAKVQDKVVHQKDYEELCESLDKPKVFVFSIPHGSVGDKTIDGLRPYLEKGDIIMDASNESWKNTERRQKKLDPDGIHYVGMGVSGGYQSARHGPSISPGGSPEALEQVMPFLEKVAAKDKQGRPCVKKLGPGGCGHYVKMVHNGIEQGMMSTLCEVWFIMNRCLGMEYKEIAKTFDKWNRSGPLVSVLCCVFVV